MKAITVRQPWASLIATGVKMIETRPRRTGYRGRIAIHAGAHRPRSEWCYDFDLPAPFDHCPDIADHFWDSEQDANGDLYWLHKWRGPLGAVVATADLTDCLPIINETDPTPDGPFVYADPGNFVQIHDGPDDSVPRYSETEVHLGDFSPGRWALLLDDIRSTTEPVHCRGQQAVPWTLPDDVADALRRQRRAAGTEVTVTCDESSPTPGRGRDRRHRQPARPSTSRERLGRSNRPRLPRRPARRAVE